MTEQRTKDEQSPCELCEQGREVDEHGWHRNPYTAHGWIRCKAIERKRSESARESAMQKTFIRARLIRAAVEWYRAGCPDANADGDGPNGELQDALHEYMDHERLVEERAQARKHG